MIYTITLNPAIDYFMDFKGKKIDTHQKTNYTSLVYGGKGINASKLLNNFNEDNTAIVFTGGSTGNLLLEILQKENINYINFDTKSNTRINVKARFDDTYEINSNSTNLNDGISEKYYTFLKENLKKGDTVMLMGSVMENLDPSILEKTSEIVSDSEARIVYDLSSDKILGLLKYKPLVIKPNIRELGDYFKVEIKNINDIEKYSMKLIEMGAENVIVSHDENGAYLFNKNEKIFTNPIKIDFVNGSGAGDSMISGFVYKLMQTNDINESFKFANASGAGTAMAEGIASATVVSELYKKVKNTKIGEKND